MSSSITTTREIPIVGGPASAKERRKERIRTILNTPEHYNKLSGLADELAKNFDSTVKIMFDLRVGAQFKDNLTQKVYAYEYFVMPFEHDVKTEVIMDLAKKPLDEFPRDHIMVVYDVAANPSPRYLISTIDFCKYVACGVWTMLDLNVGEEKQFLDDIGKGQS
jgi:hypothetical protein